MPEKATVLQVRRFAMPDGRTRELTRQGGKADDGVGVITLAAPDAD